MADIQVSKENPTSFRVKMALKNDEFEQIEKKAVANINNRVKLDGFRKGKVPDRIIKSKFKGEIVDDMLNVSLNHFYGEIVKKAPHRIFDIVKFDNVQYQENNLAYEFLYECYPYVELGKFKDIQIREHIISIEDSLLQKELRRLQKSQAQYKDSDDKTIKPQVGVMIDYEVWVDEAPAGEPNRGQRFILGENDFDPEIETEILLQKPAIGQEVTVKKTNTAQDGSEPKQYKIIVTLNDVMQVELPTLDDEFAKKVDPKVESFPQLKEKIIAELEKSARLFNLNNEFNIAVTKLAENSAFHISPRYVESKVDDFLKERKIEKEVLNDENLGQLRQSIIEQSKGRVILDHIYIEANKDKSDPSYRANFKLFLQQSHPTVNADALMKLFDDVTQQSQQLPEAFYSLLNQYLDEYHVSLLEKFFRAQGLFKKGKKFEIEEMRKFYKDEADSKK